MASENMSEQQLRGEQPSGFDFERLYVVDGRPGKLLITTKGDGSRYLHLHTNGADSTECFPALITRDGPFGLTTSPRGRVFSIPLTEDLDGNYSNPKGKIEYTGCLIVQDFGPGLSLVQLPNGQFAMIGDSNFAPISNVKGLVPFDPEAITGMEGTADSGSNEADPQDQPSFMIIDDPRAFRRSTIPDRITERLKIRRNQKIILTTLASYALGLFMGVVLTRQASTIPNLYVSPADVEPNKNTWSELDTSAAPAQIEAVPFPPQAQGPNAQYTVESATVVCEDGTENERAAWEYYCREVGITYTEDDPAVQELFMIHAREQWKKEAAAVCRQEAINAEFQRNLREQNNPTPTPVLPTATPFTPPTPIETPTPFFNPLGCGQKPTPPGCTPSLEQKKGDPTPQTSEREVPSFLIP